MPLKDPIARSEYNKEYLIKNAIRLSQLRADLRSIKRDYILSIKSNSCHDCGNVFIKEAMTFDHRPGETKYKDISSLVDHPTASLDKLKIELTKCDLVCVGCHRDRSHKRLHEYVVTCPVHRPEYKRGCKRCAHYACLARLRAKRLAMIREYKSRPCVDCGKKHEPWKMDLDHLTDKCDNVSNLVGSQASLKRILTEIIKCEVVCCWCHVIRTVKSGDQHG